MRGTSIISFIAIISFCFSCQLYQNPSNAGVDADDKEASRVDNVVMDDYGRIVVKEDVVHLCEKVKKTKSLPFRIDTLTVERWGGNGVAVRKNNYRSRFVISGVATGEYDPEFELKSLIYRGKVLTPSAKVDKPYVFDALYIKPPGNTLEQYSYEEDVFLEATKKNDFDDISIMYRYGKKCYHYKTEIKR